jgi:serine/threonine-protein kinase
MNEMPREVGGYQVLERIGAGGMGVVYRGRRPEGGGDVALKVMRADLAEDPTFVRRFYREAAIARQLNSPHIVRLLDVGEQGGVPYMVMEYVRGQTLAQLLRLGPLQVEEAVDIARQLAEALIEAYRAGVVHRDVSSQNVMLTEQGVAKLMDFGIARVQTAPTMTATGLFMGKPGYAAPETVEGHADIRTDLYALGVVLFEMLSGRLPFTAPTPLATLEMHAKATPPRLLDLGVSVPAGLEAVLQRLLAKNPKRRYQTPQAVVEALSAPDDDAMQQTVMAHFGRLAAEPRARLPRGRALYAVSVVAAVALVASLGAVALAFSGNGHGGAASGINVAATEAAIEAAVPTASPSPTSVPANVVMVPVRVTIPDQPPDCYAVKKAADVAPAELPVNVPPFARVDSVQLTATVGVSNLRDIQTFKQVRVAASLGELTGSDTVDVTVLVGPELHVNCVAEVRYTGPEGLKLRNTPSADEPHTDKSNDLKEGDRVTVIGGPNGPAPSGPDHKLYRWWYVETAKGARGWVAEGDPGVQAWLWPVN